MNNSAKNFVDELFNLLANAAAYTVMASNAPDEDKAILTAFVDSVTPGLMEECAKARMEALTDDRV